jgi:hypothetical protein
MLAANQRSWSVQASIDEHDPFGAVLNVSGHVLAQACPAGAPDPGAPIRPS